MDDSDKCPKLYFRLPNQKSTKKLIFPIDIVLNKVFLIFFFSFAKYYLLIIFRLRLHIEKSSNKGKRKNLGSTSPKQKFFNSISKNRLQTTDPLLSHKTLKTFSKVLKSTLSNAALNKTTHICVEI